MSMLILQCILKGKYLAIYTKNQEYYVKRTAKKSFYFILFLLLLKLTLFFPNNLNYQFFNHQIYKIFLMVYIYKKSHIIIF